LINKILDSEESRSEQNETLTIELSAKFA